jgi:hypothetical protein
LLNLQTKFTTMKYRNLLAFTVILFGLTGWASAQNDGGFGLKGGIGLSTLSIENQQAKDAKNNLKVGGMLGVTYEKRFGDGTFALDIEALLANKGSQQKATILNSDLTFKSNIITIDVPVSFKIYLGDNFNFYAGPYFSYLLGANLRTESKNGSNTSSNESDNWYDDKFKDNNGNLPLNTFDAGINVGLEFVTNKGFGVGARLNQGFVDITNDDYNKVIFPGILELNSDKNTFNTTLQIYGLIRF